MDIIERIYNQYVEFGRINMRKPDVLILNYETYRKLRSSPNILRYYHVTGDGRERFGDMTIACFTGPDSQAEIAVALSDMARG